MISVVLPFRNAASTLLEAVSGVLADHTVPLELVAVDDGSSDTGPALLRALDDPRVKLVANAGAGLVDALNTGISHAKYTFVARMDADDVSLPGRFGAQLDAFARDPSLTVVGTCVEAFPSSAIGEGTLRYVQWMNALITPDDHAREMFVESPLCHPTVMAKRDSLVLAGGYRAIDGPEDYDLWLRMDALGMRIAKVPEVFLRWRHHDARATVRDPRYALARFAPTKAPWLARRLRSLGRAVSVWGAGPTGRRLARALEAHGVSATRFVDVDPRKIGRIARGVPIVPPDALVRGEHTVLVAVGARGARALVRAWLTERGFVEGEDWVGGA